MSDYRMANPSPSNSLIRNELFKPDASVRKAIARGDRLWRGPKGAKARHLNAALQKAAEIAQGTYITAEQRAQDLLDVQQAMRNIRARKRAIGAASQAGTLNLRLSAPRFTVGVQ